MSAPDITTVMIDQFRASAARNHSTILLGAGASAGSGLPDWNTLAQQLLVHSGSVTNPETASLLLTQQDPLLVVQAARAAYGARWEQQLRRTLYRGVNGEDPSALHLAAVGHLLTGSGTDTSLATLNFDVLLERAIKQETGTRAYSSATGLTTNHRYPVNHLHGVITRRRSESVVLTLSDFTTLIADPQSWQLAYLKEAISRGTLIIAGTSYRDPDLRQWLHVATSDMPPGHEPLVLLARQAFGLTKVQFAEVQRALSDQWREVGLKPVLLQDHTDAAQIIRELRHIDSPGYRSPQERAATLWEAHCNQFKPLQQEYVEQLEEDASLLGEVLEARRLNVTLWMADGKGKLARWAAQDRIHRDVEGLRKVDTGHDSPWFAGQSLGEEQLLHRDIDEGSTRQWRSVVAHPITLPHPSLPSLAAAVLTVGLPGPLADYEDTRDLWGAKLSQLAVEWGARLSQTAFGS